MGVSYNEELERNIVAKSIQVFDKIWIDSPVTPSHTLSLFTQTDALLFSSQVILSLVLPQFRSQSVFSEALLLFLLFFSNRKALFKAVRRKKEKILAYCHMPCLWRLIWYRAWELWDKGLWSCTCQILPLVFCADPAGSPVWSFFSCSMHEVLLHPIWSFSLLFNYLCPKE